MKEKSKIAAVFGHRSKVGEAPEIAEGGKVAEKIITLGRRHGVPVRGDRHLIEILSTLELYEEIPDELYQAAADMLAFLYTMSGRL